MKPRTALSLFILILLPLLLVVSPGPHSPVLAAPASGEAPGFLAVIDKEGKVAQHYAEYAKP